MQNLFVLILFFAMLHFGCGESSSAEKRAPILPSTSNNGSADSTADDAVTQDFPTPGGGAANTAPTSGKKSKKDSTGTSTGGGTTPDTGTTTGTGTSGGGGRAQNCNAIFEDGYWKTWAKGQNKPDLPPSGPAPVDACKATTSNDTIGGSTNGQSAGSQRVLLKTADGCYVPNGGGPVGPLLGACTGRTWRVPY